MPAIGDCSEQRQFSSRPIFPPKSAHLLKLQEWLQLYQLQGTKLWFFRCCSTRTLRPHEHAEPHQTAVNIPAEPPNDNIIWALVSFVHENPFRLGLVALLYSLKARDRKVVRDQDGARRHASTARALNIAATVLACVVVAVYVVYVVVIFAMIK
ncbi:interferon-induced transmembrane protein 1-like [Xiphophorus maculatus]|uniref:interferon-induced transmembrane protein 1-like n=1 Tax=Xiphophorus maculatus TaxID=8083 RepID=UPI0003B47590|nr:interferon-induced transmembrane protein 1-like [Xiphophorus maculatus]